MTADRQEWWEKPGRMADLEQRFKPDGLLRLARSTPEYYDSHGHYLPGVSVLAMTYRAERDEARAQLEQAREALAFYADPRSYEEGVVPHPTRFAAGVVPIESDGGALARAALAAPADRQEP